MGATQIHTQDIASSAVTYSKLAEGTVFRGEVRMVAGTFIPAGWIPCDGKTLGKTGSGADYEGDVYRDLYDIIMALFGGTYDWNGLGKVNLPDMKDKLPIGASGTIALGSSGGAITHTHVVSGSAGSAGSHAHELVTTGLGTSLVRSGAIGYEGVAGTLYEYSGGGAQKPFFVGNQTTTIAGHTHSVSGSALADGILPPYLAFNFIIRYKGD
jgi:microcystin-dependent protein